MSQPLSADVARQIGQIAELILDDLDEVVAEMNATALDLLPEGSTDGAVTAEISASIQANVRQLLTALAAGDGRPPPPDVPPEALDVARTFVRRGIDLSVIFQGYRRAQNVGWQRWMSYAAQIAPAGRELLPLLEASSRLVFGYIDDVVAQVLAAAQREREEVLGGAIARRTETVRLILDGAPVDEREAGKRLGYELHRGHTALVLWAEGGGDAQGALESTAVMLAGSVDAPRPLSLPAGTSTLWAWLGTNDTPRPDAFQGAMADAPPNVRVAVGPTHAGIMGFRRSHAAALSIQDLLVGHPGGSRLAVYRVLEVTALAARDENRAREFVAATLGALAADTPRAARLRETLRVFLDEAEHAPRAARRLVTHRNTVLQRVARAKELLGYDPGARRLPVELALELAHQLGPRVLPSREQGSGSP